MDATEYSKLNYFTDVYISEEICAVYASNAFVGLYHKLPDDILSSPTHGKIRKLSIRLLIILSE